jgi:hypothetical protein
VYNNGNSSKNVTGASIVDGTVANADIDASAAIAQSKLATLVITNTEVADNALSGDKIDAGVISNFQSTGIDDRLATGVALYTNGTAVGVGTSSPSGTFHVKSTGNGEINVERNAGALFNVQAQSAACYIGTNSNHKFGLKSNGSVRLFVETSGDVKVGAGDLVIGTSGKGINFSATSDGTTMTSETLDDYEEGTFTPVFTPASGAFGTITPSNGGRYTKIGDTVYFWIITQAPVTDLGTASGTLYITGLPFTVASIGGSGHVAQMQNFNLGTSTTALGVNAEANTTRVFLRKNHSNTSVAYVQATELKTGGGTWDNLTAMFGQYKV